MNRIREVVGKITNYCCSMEMADIFESVLEDLEESNFNTDYINEAIDRVFIYYNEQWEVAKHYNNSPFEMDKYDTLDNFYNDIYQMCEELKEE